MGVNRMAHTIDNHSVPKGNQLVDWMESILPGTNCKESAKLTD